MSNILQKKKGFFRRVIIVLILFSFVFLPLGTKASTYEDKKRELEILRKQINENKSIIEERQKRAETLENEIAILNGQINKAELELSATKIEITQTTEAIGVKEKELIKQKDILNESLKLMYEESETTLLETLLSSRSFSTVLDRIEYLSIVKGKIDIAIDEIKKIKNELEEKKASLEGLKAQQEAQTAYLNSQKKYKDSLLAETRGEEALYQQRLLAQREEAKDVQSEMARMEAASRNRGGNYNGPPSPFGFQWPTVSHWISCYYGWEGCSIYKNRFHTGIDMPGPIGTPIYAAADGRIERVATDGYNGGYGRYILMVHSGGFRTRYAHLNEVLVGSGEVKRGQQIGRMGTTGNSTGPHLHFEILANDCIWGCDVNPLAYLP